MPKKGKKGKKGKNRNFSRISRTLNRIKINPSKSKLIIFATKAQLKNTDLSNFTITLYGNEIPRVEKVKYLGLHITSDLSWDYHILQLRRNLNRKVNQFKQFSKTACSTSLLLLTYKTFIQQILDYGISIWGCTTKKNLEKVQHIQNRAARIILNNWDFRNTRGIDLVETLKIPNVTQRRDYFLCKFTHDSILGLAPDYLVNNIDMMVDFFGHRTRSNFIHNVKLPLVRAPIYQNSLKFFGGKIWNNLPLKVKESTSQDNFKENFKNHLFSPD